MEKNGNRLLDRVTRNNLIRLVNMKQQYGKEKDEQLLQKINEYIENVINKDKKYYMKLSSYGFDDKILEYLM